jgi:hypothetical protein
MEVKSFGIHITNMLLAILLLLLQALPRSSYSKLSLQESYGESLRTMDDQIGGSGNEMAVCKINTNKPRIHYQWALQKFSIVFKGSYRIKYTKILMKHYKL